MRVHMSIRDARRLLFIEIGIDAEVGFGIAERGLLKPPKALHIPSLQHAFGRIEIDREIEEVGDEGNFAAVAHARRKQNIDAFDDENVGTIDAGRFALDDVVGHMRIDRRADVAPSRLHVGKKSQQRLVVVALRKALLVHQLFGFKDPVGQKKSVGGDELDFRRIRPSRQEGAQHARRRGFPHGHGARDADNVRNLAVLGAEKALRRLEEALRRRNVKREQARKRQIDFDDFFERDRIVEGLQPDEIIERQRQRRVGAQRRPFGARKMPVGERASLSGTSSATVIPLLRARLSLRAPTVSCAAPVRATRRPAKYPALRA